MLAWFAVLLVCQLAGEVIVVALGLPIPGPVVGMAMLFAGLLLKGGVPDGLGAATDALLGNLSLLFVPAGVGVMLHAKRLGDEILPIAAALALSTLLTIAVTAWIMHRLGRGSAGQ